MARLRDIHAVLSLCIAVSLSACATTKSPVDLAPNRTVIANPVPAPPPAPPIPAPPPAPSEPPPDLIVEASIIESSEPFNTLSGWVEADHQSALEAFRRSCEALLQADPDDPLNPNLPLYGNYGDWTEACEVAQQATKARPFFETLFAPLTLSTPDTDEGLLTGYYEPEVDVRVEPDDIFSAPILAKPKSRSVQNLPRAKLGPNSARVIAYGRPIDVFFLQIQGSGRLRYGDGRTLRAAYGGNNGKPYRSIGSVLIKRGELSRNQSGKRNIEAWMVEAGPEQSRALMNENPRYIFFAEQAIAPGEGPRGAMQVPLTAMGSIAVDPRSHPYGMLAWLETRLPQSPGDYTGDDIGLLVVAQDTGSAIKGALRGDLFFGAGNEAGALAGVMKHPVRWTVLVPRALIPTPSLKPDPVS